ncbi:MAG: hypothetical protein IKL08_02655 [Clostridia bacterium]|nr:hypothetical protein [Clostridia bacterium]
MKKRGVTLITLSIIVAVMAILTAVTVNIGTDIHVGAQKARFQAEIDQIEILTSNYIRRNSGNDFTPYTWNIASLVGYDETQFEGETITSGNINVYVVDLTKIDAEETNDGLLEKGANDRYLYSEQTGHVYYEKGKTFGNKVYYRVTELEE